MNCTIHVAKTKAQISCAVNAQLICAFGFTYADCWFSEAVAHFILLPVKFVDLNVFSFIS